MSSQGSPEERVKTKRKSMNTRRKERKQLVTKIADCILDNTCGRIAQWPEEARLTIKTSAEAEVEDVNNKAEEDFKEDSIIKAEASTAMEEDSKEEDSNNKAVDVEEAEATSIQTTSTSNSQ